MKIDSFSRHWNIRPINHWDKAARSSLVVTKHTIADERTTCQGPSGRWEPTHSLCRILESLHSDEFVLFLTSITLGASNSFVLKHQTLRERAVRAGLCHLVQLVLKWTRDGIGLNFYFTMQSESYLAFTYWSWRRLEEADKLQSHVFDYSC